MKEKNEKNDPIILATTVYSGGGQYTEEAIRGQGIKSFCIRDCIFETNPKEDLLRFEEFIKEIGADAIIVDNHWTAQGITAISNGLIEFADKMLAQGIVVFCLNREQSTGFRCELWQFNKPLKFKDMKYYVKHLARIGTFGSETFDVDGKPKSFSGGDRGIEDREHSLYSGRAFIERDWPNILKKVKEEMQS